MTSIETDGFLSPEIQDFRAHLRTQIKALASECEDVSRRARGTQPYEPGTQ